jgi:hypothetical protein
VSRLGSGAGGVETFRISDEALLGDEDLEWVDLTTPSSDWAWGAIGALSPSLSTGPVGLRLVMDIELVSGTLGVFYPTMPRTAYLAKKCSSRGSDASKSFWSILAHRRMLFAFVALTPDLLACASSTSLPSR